MTHTCSTESNERRIQSQLNDVATRLPLHLLGEYLETLQLEFRKLPGRIQQLQDVMTQQGTDPSCENVDNNLRIELEALQRELQEMPIHIQRVQNAIKARQRKFSSREPEWFRIREVSNSEERMVLVQREVTRNPIAMIRSEYKGMKLADIAAKVLGAASTPLTTTELTQTIYCTRSNDEFERARNSLSTELRVGAKSSNPRWRKCGRYAYCGLHIHPEAAM